MYSGAGYKEAIMKCPRCSNLIFVEAVPTHEGISNQYKCISCGPVGFVEGIGTDKLDHKHKSMGVVRL